MKTKKDVFANANDFLGRWFNFFNFDESSSNFPDHGESWTLSLILDIPLDNFDKSMMDDLDAEFKGNSHGVEGNPGGICSHGWVSEPVLMINDDLKDNFMRITIEHSCVFDI